VRRSVFASKCDSVTEDVVVCMYRRPTAVQDRPVDSNEDDFATEITTYRPWRITQTVRSIVMACLTTTTRKKYVGVGCGGS
jgi:hypothetical protein